MKKELAGLKQTVSRLNEQLSEKKDCCDKCATEAKKK